jgi:hypothetical protein
MGLLTLPGCQARPDSAQPEESAAAIIPDCTEYHHGEVGSEPPELLPSIEAKRSQLFEVATRWLYDDCLWPCTFDLCAAITYADSEVVELYVRLPEPYVTEEYFRIGPEAELTLSALDLKVLAGTTWHSGGWRRGCARDRPECQHK